MVRNKKEEREIVVMLIQYSSLLLSAWPLSWPRILVMKICACEQMRVFI